MVLSPEVSAYLSLLIWLILALINCFIPLNLVMIDRPIWAPYFALFFLRFRQGNVFSSLVAFLALAWISERFMRMGSEKSREVFRNGEVIIYLYSILAPELLFLFTVGLLFVLGQRWMREVEALGYLGAVLALYHLPPYCQMITLGSFFGVTPLGRRGVRWILGVFSHNFD